MEFLDEDARPRYLFQSKPLQSTNQETQEKKFNKPFIFVTFTISSILLILSLTFLQTEPVKSLLFWVSISFLIGPFAPSNITAGDIRVGQGPILEIIDQEPETVPERQVTKKRTKPVRSEDVVVSSLKNENGLVRNEKKSQTLGRNENGLASNERESEWNDEDIEVLKKQMAKNPVGKVRRWEVIAEAFNGRHRVESVIKKAKELGERKLDDSDSYAQFLKKRKPVDTRVQGEIEGGNNGGEIGKVDGGDIWSAGEDIVLLNALKVFPKDVTLRWEKIAAAVPGKSKASCMKRVAELKRDFRSSKASYQS